MHNRQYEAKKNQHYAYPLFNYLQQLCYPIELVRQEESRVAASTRGSSNRALLAAALMVGTIGVRNFGEGN